MGYQLVTDIPYTDLLAVGCWTPIIAAHASASALRKFVALGWTQPHQRTTHRHKRLVRKRDVGKIHGGIPRKDISDFHKKSRLQKKVGNANKQMISSEVEYRQLQRRLKAIVDINLVGGGKKPEFDILKF